MPNGVTKINAPELLLGVANLIKLNEIEPKLMKPLPELPIKLCSEGLDGSFTKNADSENVTRNT